MTRVRIFACVGAAIALVVLGLCLPTLREAATEGMGALFGPSAGLVLFGFAMLAAALAFRSAMVDPKASVVSMERPRTSEFRRGFAKTSKTPAAGQRPLHKPSHHQPSQYEVVVALRRAVAGQANEVQPGASAIPRAEIERLQDLLHNRAAQLWVRNVEHTQRRFLRSGVDAHGLAES